MNEIKTIYHCDKKATMNYRIDDQGQAMLDGAQIEIGDNERYVTVCRKHFKEAQNASILAKNKVPFSQEVSN